MLPKSMSQEKVEHYKTSSSDIYPFLETQAKTMRHNQTDAEYALWQELRGKALGYKFRRQHPVGDYIADFVCLKAKLVIEVDGEYHLTPHQQLLDIQRTEALQQMGFREIRFSNDAVLFDRASVIEEIKNNL